MTDIFKKTVSVVLTAFLSLAATPEPTSTARLAPSSLAPSSDDERPPACASPLLDEARAAHERLCQEETCAPEDLAVLDAAVAALRACALRRQELSEVPPLPAAAARWIFPVSRMRPQDSMGGPDGKGYLKNRRVTCYASARTGHPAHDLFVRDRRQSGRDREGRAFEALAVEAGYVLATREGWTPENGGAGGNYVLLYLPARNWVAYYAHLDTVAVRAGDRVEAGAVLGKIGRSGRNAWASRSPTHLHFAIWEPGRNWMPIDPYAMLRRASVSSASASE
ncbi:MAG: M23 family metallopeptidase [Myxococcales bacterium]|jgi:hypothetical protein|nr:M23 family metallopeptidase [Myxococcales bacterium]